MPEQYKTFPPRWAHLRIPTSSRQAARAGLALYAPCKRGGLLMLNAAWALTFLFGPTLLPGPQRAWDPPMPGDTWSRLWTTWRQAFGPIETAAIYGRPQRLRSGFAVLLLQEGRAVAFVKLRHDEDAALTNEHRALTTLRESGRTPFWAPAPLETGCVDDWYYLATTSLPARLHRPARSTDLPRLLEGIQQGLRSLPRPADVPAHWTPMHGDLTPWNLRMVPGVGSALFDWEEAGWGPPDADGVLFRATAAVLSDQRAGPAPAETTAYWCERLRARPPADSDRSLNARLLQTLSAMNGT